MRKLAILVAAAFVIACFAGPALADKPGPEPGQQLIYNLNVIGFANCVMDPQAADGEYPECFKGEGWDSNGHRIFVPLKTKHQRNICDPGGLGDVGDVFEDDGFVTILQRGVRILVTDGADIGVIDGDATDGTARFSLPHGQYEIWARALGKPSTEEQARCMEINTLICEDEVSDDVYERVDCSADLSNDRWVLTGYLDVKRSKNKPQWQNATDAMLAGTGALDGAPYMDFMWQIYNEHLKLLQIRFYEVPENG